MTVNPHYYKLTGNEARNQLVFYTGNPFKNEQTQKIENREFNINFI